MPNRTMTDKNTTTSQCKKIFMKMIANNETIFKLIDNKEVEYADDLINKNIFSQIMIDFKPERVETYIGIKIDYPSVCANEMFKNYYFTIMIISNKQHLKVPAVGESRTDLISAELIKIFNWNNDIDFRLQLKSDVEDVLNENFYYRRLVFSSIAFNNENRHQ